MVKLPEDRTCHTNHHLSVEECLRFLLKNAFNSAFHPNAIAATIVINTENENDPSVSVQSSFFGAFYRNRRKNVENTLKTVISNGKMAFILRFAVPNAAVTRTCCSRLSFRS